MVEEEEEEDASGDGGGKEGREVEGSRDDEAMERWRKKQRNGETRKKTLKLK